MLGSDTTIALRDFYAQMREDSWARHGVLTVIRNVQDHDGALCNTSQYLVLSVLFEMQFDFVPTTMRQRREGNEI